MHCVFQSLRDFKPLFAGAAYNYGAFGDTLPSKPQRMLSPFSLMGSERYRVVDGYTLEEVFVTWGAGCGWRELKTPGILTQGSRGHTGRRASAVPAARRFECFAAHLFVIEHGTTVADRLALLGEKRGSCAVRDASLMMCES